MRGFFGIGVEGLSKAINAGNLFRSAHAFGASFTFTIGGVWSRQEAHLADTSDAPGQVPFYRFETVADMKLPSGCELVGIELLDSAVELPSFRHPRAAAYVLGPERGSLSPALVEQCSYIVKIPTSFCINVSVAGAVVMYDRIINLGRFPARPLHPKGKPEPVPAHVHGGPVFRQE
jgi:tRNA G18 (ribose-2'-O)-methylase SpoU